jgi:hypothetical protein
MGIYFHFLAVIFLTAKLFLPTAFIISIPKQGIIVIFIIGLISLMIGLLIYMFFYMYFKSKYEKKHDKWRTISDLLIRKAVFYDDEEMEAETLIPVTARAEKLMRNKHFRKLLTGEITSAKKNIAGIAADNLKHLYQQLQLDKYALKNLKSRHWHIKATAIQELTVMEMKEFLTNLYPYTNNHNELVRMEAQTAIVQFYGFEGLKFLDIITYPISEWQQIKLLQQLSNVPPVDISIDNWLKSTNNSVVVFTLKLARNYHRFELHDLIISCLDHTDPEVRLQAMHYLCEIYTDETSDHLISRFLKESFKQRLAMVKGMQSLGTEKDTLFLLSLLDDDSNEMKLYAARALAHMGKNGLVSLEAYAKTASYPLNEILMQIKGELAA